MSSTLSSSITVIDPSTGESGATFPIADRTEVDAAVTAAQCAQPLWAATPATERGAALRRAASAIRARREELARRNARDSGKLIADARGGVDAAAATIEQYAELGPLHRGRALNGDRLAFDAMRYEPRGLVAALVPFNDPIAVAGQASRRRWSPATRWSTSRQNAPRPARHCCLSC